MGQQTPPLTPASETAMRNWLAGKGRAPTTRDAMAEPLRPVKPKTDWLAAGLLTVGLLCLGLAITMVVVQVVQPVERAAVEAAVYTGTTIVGLVLDAVFGK